MRKILSASLRSLIQLADKWSKEQGPKMDLQPEHLAQCRVLPSRQHMLEYLPKNGAGAEVGVNEGAFSQQIWSRCQPEVLYLIDFFDDPRKLALVQSAFSTQIDRNQVRLLRGNSLQSHTEIADFSLDFVYIDTDHSYQTTIEELRIYSKKLKPAGLLMGHDYITGNWRGRVKYGVIEAVHQFCTEANWEMVYLTNELSDHPSFALRRCG